MRTQKTSINFTAIGVVYCGCGRLCLGGAIQKYTLLKNEVNVVREGCFKLGACIHIKFYDLQFREVKDCKRVLG